MERKTNFKRIVSMVLCMVMLLSLAPGSALAIGETILGDQETIQTAQEDGRERDFNKGWKFDLGDNSSAQNVNFDDSSWESVDLPHDFSITQSYTTSGEAESGFLPGGTGWYRKSFTLPESDGGKTFLLNFDGVYMHAYVYVNGTKVGEHHYGYTAFAFDITDYLICDGKTENVIAVKAVNNLPSSRWYSGSGIYRDVTLFVLDPVHVDLNGTQITTPNIAQTTSSTRGLVKGQVTVVNDGDSSASVTVTNTVYKKGSSEALASASTAVTVAPGSSADTTASPVVTSPALWSIEDPALYILRTELIVDGEVVDTYDTEFGFRYFSFDRTGFHLNGENVKLNGVCMHHDQGGLGAAAYYDAMYRQLSIMKDMGCNAIRTAHNPADEDFIAICNELGLLVIEETFDGLVDAKNGNTNDFSGYFEQSVDTGLYGASSGMTCAEYAARSTVRRDRNAPSVIAWSFGNEIQEGTDWSNVARYDEICADYITWVNDEDGSRPVTNGDNNRGGDSRLVDVLNTIVEAGGVVGFNYANSAATLYSLAQSYGGVIIASETASHTNSRGQYRNQYNNSNSDGKYHLTSYDTSAVGWGITAHDSIYNTYQYDCVAGEFVWTGFDYLGEPTPWNGTVTGSVSGAGAYPNSSYFGIVETTGFEKDTYYLYRSQWNKSQTTLHLVTAWDADNMMTTNGKTPVWVYSNAPKVKLYRNGELIGTATRNEVTSPAGHTYFTYTTQSNDSSICTTSSGTGADGLYAVFNVTYESGTIYAKAFDESGKEIALSGNSGRNAVSTPDAAYQLLAYQNKTQIPADGSSLAYIWVDVTDNSGNLDTTATNTINISLTGNGKILAVDNGDQATTAKYQQSSVLFSDTSAQIAAYAGKALVIVQSTEEAGSFTVTVSSNGLVQDAVTVTTTPTGEEAADTDLVSYAMIRDYTVKVGTAPTLDTAATGTLGNGKTITGTIAWEPISDELYNVAGDYTITGTLTFEGYDPIPVTARLHVIDNVIALRNISTVTAEGTVPTLPSTATGLLADGTTSGEFTVTWEDVNASRFATAGNIVTVSGTAVIFGEETLPVTCTVRVAEPVVVGSTNVAPMAAKLTEDVTHKTDVLSSVINGTRKPGDNTSERWTNWNNRHTSDTATLTFRWDTAQSLSSATIYYYYDNCCAKPQSVTFQYSLDGTIYQTVGSAETLEESYSLGACYSYTFDQTINPVYLKVTFQQQNGTSGLNCVGVTELELYTAATTLEYNSSADLSGIAVDGTALADFSADTLAYTAAGSTVTATSDVNAGITVLPAQDDVVKIITLSEDGTASKTYQVTLDGCAHANTETRNQKEATCTENGYTGDIYCIDCQKVIELGTVITATGHQHTQVRDKVEAGCETTGYTGDTYCTDCGAMIATGSVVAAKGHSWDEGVVTKEPTESEGGIRTYTCTVCGGTKTESIPFVKELKAPTVSLKVTADPDTGKLVLTGVFEDHENKDDYYEVTSRGLLYMYKFQLGNRVLHVKTPGRTRVSFRSIQEDGSFTYQMSPTYGTTLYAVRAFLSYVDPDTGKTVYVYSDVQYVRYNDLLN